MSGGARLGSSRAFSLLFAAFEHAVPCLPCSACARGPSLRYRHAGAPDASRRDESRGLTDAELKEEWVPQQHGIAVCKRTASSAIAE